MSSSPIALERAVSFDFQSAPSWARQAPAANAMASSGKDNIAIFAINLDRRPDRMAAINRAFGHLRWPMVRIAALDAARDPEAVLAVRGQSLNFPPRHLGWNPLRQRLFTLAEEACFASHIVALRAFLASGYRLGLIIEDDACPTPGITAVLEDLARNQGGREVVKLEGRVKPGKRLAVAVGEAGGHDIVRSLRPSCGSAAYLVTRSGAAKLIDNAGQLLAPYDDYLSNPGLHGATMAHMAPWPIHQADFGSEINGGRKPIKRRDPVSFARQFMRRVILRAQLVADALNGPGLFKLTFARWSAPELLAERPSPPLRLVETLATAS